MTVKKLERKQAELDEMVRKRAVECGLTRDDVWPIYDGIADESRYLASELKIAWILKEPYDDFDEFGNPCGGGWSLVKNCFLEHDENWVTKDGRNQWANPVWQKVAYVMYGFRHGLKWDSMEWIRNRPSMMDELKALAWINVRKMPAHTSSADGGFKDKYERVWKTIVGEQMRVFDPKVMIFGYTFSCFREDWKDSLVDRKDLSNEWATIYKMDDKYLVDTYHPGRKGGAYVDALIKVLTKIKHEQ